MKKLVLYHGSERLIKKPVFGYGNKHNDYGLCFYCSIDKQLGKEWACRENSSGYINSFIIDVNDNLKILDLTNKKEYSVLNWIAILLKYRVVSSQFKARYKEMFEFLDQYYIDVEQFDLIIGYRADDSYFAFPLAFIENKLSLERLNEIYMLGDLGVQYAIKSKYAFDSLRYLDSELVGMEYNIKYKTRIYEAKRKYDEILNICSKEKGTFIRDLVNKYDKL